MFYVNSIDVSAKEYICRKYIMEVLGGDDIVGKRGLEVIKAVMAVYPNIVESEAGGNTLAYAAALSYVSEIPIKEIVELTLKNETLDTFFGQIYNTEFVQNLVNGAQTLIFEVVRDEEGNLVSGAPVTIH